jgi:hypothetical protein
MQKTTLANSRPAATVEAVRAAHAAKLLAVAKMRKQLGEFERDLDKADKIHGSLSSSKLALKREMTGLTEQLSEMPKNFVASAATVEAVKAANDIVGSAHGDDMVPHMEMTKQTLLKLSPGKGLGIVADEDMYKGDIAGIYVLPYTSSMKKYTEGTKTKI